MKRYLLTLFAVGLLTGCMRYVFGATKCEKYVKWIASLMTVLVFLTPLLSLIGDIPDSISLPKPDVTMGDAENTEDIVLALARDRLCRKIDQLLKEEGIVAKNIEVCLQYRNEDAVFTVEIISLSLNRRDELKGRAILSKQFDCKIEIYSEDSA